MVFQKLVLNLSKVAVPHMKFTSGFLSGALGNSEPILVKTRISGWSGSMNSSCSESGSIYRDKRVAAISHARLKASIVHFPHGDFVMLLMVPSKVFSILPRDSYWFAGCFGLTVDCLQQHLEQLRQHMYFYFSRIFSSYQITAGGKIMTTSR